MFSYSSSFFILAQIIEQNRSKQIVVVSHQLLLRFYPVFNAHTSLGVGVCAFDVNSIEVALVTDIAGYFILKRKSFRVVEYLVLINCWFMFSSIKHFLVRGLKIVDSLWYFSNKLRFFPIYGVHRRHGDWLNLIRSGSGAVWRFVDKLNGHINLLLRPKYIIHMYYNRTSTIKWLVWGYHA